MNYWDNYYKKQREIRPSKFAFFCIKYLKPKSSILDMGCGNGRDSIFFKNVGFNVIGVDSAKIVDRDFPFLNLDFTKLPDFSVDNVYMRLSLHSITKRSETRLMKWIYRNLLKGCLCIEVRGLNDELYGKGKNIGKHEYVYGHYRRFVDKKELEKSLTKLGFNIIYLEESRDFAPTDKENPKMIRMVVKK